jgi:hypothetical protein
VSDTRQLVRRLALEQPHWIPVLEAACAQARTAEPFGGEFAGSYVVQEVSRVAGQRVHVPGLRILVTYGLLEKSGESTRGGRRAYYRMPERASIEAALAELPNHTPPDRKDSAIHSVTSGPEGEQEDG